MTLIFGVDEDGSVVIIGEDMSEGDIREAHESGWWSIFRIAGEDIVYLNISQITNVISWEKAILDSE